MTHEEGLFGAYLRYSKEQESPDVFHRWTLVSMVSSLLGRRCWIDRKFYTLYPNSYIILVSPSGKSKKDTAINDIGMGFLKECPTCPEFYPGQLNWSTLVGHLAKMGSRKVPETGERLDASIYLVAPEFTNFIGRPPMSSLLVDKLTGLYGCPDVYPYLTRAHGHEELHNVCLNLIGGSTVKWLKEAIPEGAVSGGFTGRVIFVFSDQEKPRRMFPLLPKDWQELRKRVVYDLSCIGAMSGEFLLDPDAEEAIKEWYENKLSYSTDDPLGPFFERKADHILKLSMVISASESEDMSINKGHVLQAKEWIDSLEKGMLVVLTDVELTPQSETTKRIYEVIRSKGSMSRVDLQRRIVRYADKQQLDLSLDTLTTGSFVKVFLKDGKRTWYKVTNKGKEFG